VPKPGVYGNITYFYTISDGCGGEDTAKVTVCIDAPPPPPPPPPPPGGDSPLVIDLDGNGIHTVAQSESNAHFDFNDGNGPRHTAWFAPGDGILVHDINGNGTVDDV